MKKTKTTIGERIANRTTTALLAQPELRRKEIRTWNPEMDHLARDIDRALRRAFLDGANARVCRDFRDWLKLARKYGAKP